jgi:hypothetical protein
MSMSKEKIQSELETIRFKLEAKAMEIALLASRNTNDPSLPGIIDEFRKLEHRKIELEIELKQ